MLCHAVSNDACNYTVILFDDVIDEAMLCSDVWSCVMIGGARLMWWNAQK